MCITYPKAQYKIVICTDLGAAVLDLCKQVKAMTNGYCWLAREKTDSHQCQTDPRQPVLACLTVGIEESPDALRHINLTIYTQKSDFI